MADTTPAKDTKPAAKDAAPKAAAEKKAPAAAPKVTAEKKATAAAAKVTAEKKAPTAKAAAPKTTVSTARESTAPASTSDASASAATIVSTKAPKSAPAKKAAKPVVEARPQVLKMHHLRPAAGSKTARTRVGRGEGSKGKTAGRGTKGTKARYQVRLGLEGGNLSSIMRTPKLRGFTNPFRVEYQVVNLEKLAELYPTGGDVTVSDLVAKGAVRKNEKVKVLGDGDIAVKLNVAVDKVSGSAEQKIVAAGGSIH